MPLAWQSPSEQVSERHPPAGSYAAGIVATKKQGPHPAHYLYGAHQQSYAHALGLNAAHPLLAALLLFLTGRLLQATDHDSRLPRYVVLCCAVYAVQRSVLPRVWTRPNPN